MTFRTFFRNLVPQEKKFYPMFEAMADNNLKAAILLNKLFAEDEEGKREAIYMKIKEIETQGDRLCRAVFEELDKTFITPFERDDIHKLSSSIESVLDSINGCSHRIELYKPKHLEAGFSEFPSLILLGCQEVQQAVSHLKNLKDYDQIRKSCNRISNLEGMADELHHRLISNLFQTEKNAIELIKKKEIVQTLEKTMDQIEDVGDVCRTILLKMV